jgi:hypothetical protein
MPSNTTMENFTIRFSDVLEKDEQLLWGGRPKFLPFVIPGILIGLFEIGVGTTVVMLMNKPENDRSFTWVFGLVFVALGVWAMLRKLLSFGNTFYACSNRRVMIRSGIAETIITVIDHHEIINMQVKVGIFEKMFQTGSIRFFNGKTKTDPDNTNVTTKVYDGWEAIPDPYGVFKKVKEIIAGIKSANTHPHP